MLCTEKNRCSQMGTLGANRLKNNAKTNVTIRWHQCCFCMNSRGKGRCPTGGITFPRVTALWLIVSLALPQPLRDADNKYVSTNHVWRQCFLSRTTWSVVWLTKLWFSSVLTTPTYGSWLMRVCVEYNNKKLSCRWHTARRLCTLSWAALRLIGRI